MTDDEDRLKRFVDAQALDYADAIAALRSRTLAPRWMAHIFPSYVLDEGAALPCPAPGQARLPEEGVGPATARPSPAGGWAGEGVRALPN